MPSLYEMPKEDAEAKVAPLKKNLKEKMPSACETPSSDSRSATDVNSQQTNGQSTTTTTTKGSNGTAKAAAAGFIDDDVDYEMPTRATAPAANSDSTVATVVSASSSPPSQNGEKAGGEATASSDDFIFIQDTGFNVKIAPPGMEPFELQVRVWEVFNYFLIFNPSFLPSFHSRSRRWS